MNTMRLMILLCLVSCLILEAFGQNNNCENDEDCDGDDNCCSDFGFCGTGEGFCTPSPRRPSGTSGTARRAGERRRSGAGCVLEDVELVGGDLPALAGGGGIKLDRDTPEQCFNRCEENPGCKWYTYDGREDLCYLKSGRGYIRNRTDDFTSGATFRDGCNSDPFCDSPYSFHRQQCLLFSSQFGQDNDLFSGVVTLADARRNLNHSRKLCGDLGGFLPYDLSGFNGGPDFGNTWHWLGYPQEKGKCWACRPGRWGEGVRGFPCSQSLPYVCQRRRAFPLPIPARPRSYSPAGSDGVTRICGIVCRRRLRSRVRNILLSRRQRRRRITGNTFLTL